MLGLSSGYGFIKRGFLIVLLMCFCEYWMALISASLCFVELLATCLRAVHSSLRPRRRYFGRQRAGRKWNEMYSVIANLSFACGFACIITETILPPNSYGKICGRNWYSRSSFGLCRYVKMRWVPSFVSDLHATKNISF